MTLPTLHIVFNSSGAEVLRHALAAAGRDDYVVGLPDNLGFGPIEPLDPDYRQEWAIREFGEFPRADAIEGYDAFWDIALSPGIRHVVWTSKRSTQDFAGFLAYLWRLGDLDCNVVDLTDFMLIGRNP